MLNNKLIIGLIFTAAVLLSACNASGEYPGREYMPDMAHSKAYEPYVVARTVVADGEEVEISKNGASAREPVVNTVPRGHAPYHYRDTITDYVAAGMNLTNPFNSDFMAAADRAKGNYTIYCAICHGAKGKGQGKLIEGGAYPSPGSYFDKMDLKEGQMYHSIHWGKNLMGSYASQLSQEERWELVAYIKKMQAEQIMKDLKIDKEKLPQVYAAITGPGSGYDEATKADLSTLVSVDTPTESEQQENQDPTEEAKAVEDVGSVVTPPTGASAGEGSE